MKRIFIFLHFFVAVSAFGQISNDKLLGTWQLIEYKTPDGRMARIGDTKFKRLKTFSHEQFTVLDFNPAGNIIMTAINGGYQLQPSKGIGSYDDLVPDSSVLSEYVSGVSRESAGILGGRPFYGLKIDSLGLLHYTGVYKTTGSETWMKLIEHRMEMLPALISKKPEDQKFKIDPRMMIVLHNGKMQSVEVKANAKFPQPLNIINQIDVEGIEFIGNADAVEQYGMRGVYGVFNLTISEANYDKVTAVLRKQGNIR